MVAAYTYNGLGMSTGWRIGWRFVTGGDADADADVDGSDPWCSFAMDDRWRMVATFRDGLAASRRSSSAAERGPPSPSMAASTNPVDSFLLTDLIAAPGGPQRAHFRHAHSHSAIARFFRDSELLFVPRFPPSFPGGGCSSCGQLVTAE